MLGNDVRLDIIYQHSISSMLLHIRRSCTHEVRQIQQKLFVSTANEFMFAPLFSNFLDNYREKSYLWIDQICIDQDSINERIRQVNYRLKSIKTVTLS